MDLTLGFALSASIISSLGGLAGGFLLLAQERIARNLSHYLMSFAAGVLLSITFADLFPEAMQGFDEPETALTFTLIGVVGFFLLERLLAAFHLHQDAAYQPRDETTAALVRARPLVVIGDSVHNFVDGVVIAVTFLTSVPLGIAATFSILLHELPHEIADFTILLRSGMKRASVLLVNLISALVAPVGTIFGYFFASQVLELQAPLLALAAGNFLYLALADLLPHLFHERGLARVSLQTLLFLAGIVFILLLPSE